MRQGRSSHPGYNGARDSDALIKYIFGGLANFRGRRHRFLCEWWTVTEPGGQCWWRRPVWFIPTRVAVRHSRPFRPGVRHLTAWVQAESTPSVLSDFFCTVVTLWYVNCYFNSVISGVCLLVIEWGLRQKKTVKKTARDSKELIYYIICCCTS